ncbi:MAG TPA: cation diffusion facilitator family transporter [Methanoculleus sp.]|jgi:cation diffusion facilitator family transporter|uniref:cation diffusion facilitator family transporter n=1 Tax=Methanoculleus sp. TaxID=90427 RepID=UPI000A86786D|nr:cation diffusion facilitator family transporter [Methanoculleus sp.]MBP7143606.1 cation transporter [Methanoculleus sp.]HNV37800.1 cation diffusion facilitator family transporter [Methanoculleus sp.]HPK80952.1 cation diffusion facilitator family transporter [Methanoculleus sp.]
MQGDRVQRVFVIVLILNVAVAVVKAVFGVMAGSVSMVADALHSGFDSFSNVVGIVAMHLAGKPPDPEHPYGHGKIETLGTLVIGAMLLLTAAGILLEGYGRLITPVTPEITPITVGVMVGTLITNIIVSTYERRKGEEYQSQILIADSLHTRSDVFVSTAVLGGFLAIRLGYPAADPIIALGIGLLIARMGVGILYGAAEVLIDSMNLPCDPALVRAVVMDTPGVAGYHDFRCRGKPGEIFADIHVTVDPALSIARAHAISEEVEQRLKETVPGLAEVVVHIEPDDSA